ncbi:MAG: UDP-N-acetylmuramate--L-alanine ligase [Parachlamydiaceae bacterium]|nr:UDP-N-acetylmuramate--L-alanine ligase [Parachlamydiaceae bacterium]
MVQKCHFIGVGGIGMSGLARLMLGKKAAVTGSDIASSYVTEGLVRDGAKVYIGHSADHITADMTVVYSTEIKKDNPEYLAAQRLQCAMLHRSDLLLKLTTGSKTLAVAGTHGKTTTSALLASVLIEGKLNPSYAVGGILNQFKSNAGYGPGEYFVAEADESDGTFLKYDSFGAIITNIDLDHMNHFGTEANLIDAFKVFAEKVASTKHLFWCGDDARLQALALPGISYGLNSSCDLRALNIVQNSWKLVFDIDFKNKRYPHVEVNLVGHHNVLNALAVFGLALTLGVEEAAIRKALLSFGGVARRCDKKGELQKVLFLDDYAHHPTEIQTTLNGIREAIGERRLIALFQPHRYTRTKDCLGTYGSIFEAADEIIVTDIFSAGETPIEGVTTEKVVQEITDGTVLSVQYVARKDLNDYLMKQLQPHDVVVTLGAGDITKLGSEMVLRLSKEKIKPLRVGLIFGGRSVEHEVSLISTTYVQGGLQQEGYTTIPFGIAKDGTWLTGEQAHQDLKDYVEGTKKPVKNEQMISKEVLSQILECDLFFPILHGSYGEDGAIQGFFETLDKPYTGCDQRAAALCMDKVLTKKVVGAAGLKTADYVAFNHYEWHTKSESIKQKIVDELVFPLYVKPVHLGSSIAVTRVENMDQLDNAIQVALRVDTHAMVETAVQRCREIEFAVMGNNKVTVFPPAEVRTEGRFLAYDGKYGDKALAMDAIAHLPEKVMQVGMELAEKAYRAAGCAGFSRVDFFLDVNGVYWFNEINTIPGCTPTSQYPIVCTANGLSSHQVIDRIVISGLQRKRLQRRVAVKYGK